MVFAAIYANQAFAAIDPANAGWIQVCKQSAAAPNAVIGNFRFEIKDTVGSDIFVNVPVGLCSGPIQVGAGTVTVRELGSDTAMHANGTIGGTPDGTSDFTSFFSATASGVGLSGATGTYDSATMTFTVVVPKATPASNQSSAVTVTFTNTLDPGTIEVCKQIVTGSGLTGTFTFTVTGSNGFTFTTPPVAIGACTEPITVPAGFVKVVETGDNAENVTAITATKTASNVDAVVGPNPTAPKYDLPTATVVVSVDPGDASMQTIVTFTNNSVRLKLCKAWDGNGVADPATRFSDAGPVFGPTGPE